MHVELSMSDVDLAMSRDLNAMNQLEDRAMDKLLLRIFGTTDQELVCDVMRVLLADKDIQARVLAMRAARRMGVDK